MCIGLHVQHPLLLSDFNEIKLSQQIFEKYPNIKFHENRIFPCGQMDGPTDRQTDRYNGALVALRNFCERAEETLHFARTCFYVFRVFLVTGSNHYPTQHSVTAPL